MTNTIGAIVGVLLIGAASPWPAQCKASQSPPDDSMARNRLAHARVAAVQENSIRAGDRSDDKPIADNLEAALAILKKLDVTVDRWPS